MVTEHLLTAGLNFSKLHIPAAAWYFIGGVFFVIVVMLPMNSYVKQWRRMKAIRGKILLLIRKPAGGIEFELCPVRGRAVYRYVDKSGEIKKVLDPRDPRVGTEVYFLRERNPDVVLVKQDTEYKDSSGKTRTGVKERTLSIRDAEDEDIDLESNPVLHTGRPHITWPISADNTSRGFFDAPVSIPVAEVVEGQNEEVDTLSVAINTWKSDPKYIAGMAGILVDEKVSSLMVFWNKINKELIDKLSKFVNPMFVYVGLGLCIIMIGICIYYITKQNTQISNLQKLIETIPGIGIMGK